MIPKVWHKSENASKICHYVKLSVAAPNASPSNCCAASSAVAQAESVVRVSRSWERAKLAVPPPPRRRWSARCCRLESWEFLGAMIPVELPLQNRQSSSVQVQLIPITLWLSWPIPNSQTGTTPVKATRKIQPKAQTTIRPRSISRAITSAKCSNRPTNIHIMVRLHYLL